MGGMSISGLASGLDTASLIDQLMNLERAPVRRLETRRTDIQNSIKSFNELNDKFKAIRTAADALTSTLDWAARKVSSSNEAVATATVSGSAQTGSLSFNVTALASAHSVVSASTVAGTAAVVADGTDFTVNGVTVTAADYGTGTLTEVVDAINAADAGVTAAAVQVSPGQYRLQITSETSGDASDFTVTGTGLTAALGAFGIVTDGSSAVATIGTGPAAYEVRSDSNTFADVIPGVTFTAHSTGAVTLTVGNDGEALADKVAKLVEAVNEASKYILDRSKYDKSTEKAGVFLGNSMPARLRDDLVNAVIDAVPGSALVGASVGITTDRTGAITFDRAKFLEAYDTDPAAVEGFFGANVVADTADDGLAERVSLVAEAATAINTGRISLAISSRESEVTSIDDRIDQWDIRLELKETSLRRMFTSLETNLSTLQQQGNWLAGQLASLPKIESNR